LYYPGDLGFDPLGLKPKDAKGFASMQEKELLIGRLAMIAAAGAGEWYANPCQFWILLTAERF
jgi:hypothetical protein